FAYRANRSVEDAVNMGLHDIRQHKDYPGTYARILFVDFSLAFNTIIPKILSSKLYQLTVPPALCQWITSFLTDRPVSTVHTFKFLATIISRDLKWETNIKRPSRGYPFCGC
ncbi:hypothetical protein NFI96_014247, partial [Prochilodus magdalenae]